jgi:glycosyltransferase involved in cell wall biosynthesis
MKTLYIGRIPGNIERQKAEQISQVTVMGSQIYLSEVFAAILKYGTYDLILLPKVAAQSARFDQSDLYQENRERIRLIEEHDLSIMANHDPAVIFFPDQNMSDGVRLRRVGGNPRTSIIGIIHSIHYSGAPANILRLMVSGLQSHDALICSSNAGRQAIANYIELAKERTRRIGVGNLEARFQLPLIPLGTNTEAFQGNEQSSIRAELGLDSEPLILYFGRFSETSKADLYPVLLVFSQLLAFGCKASMVFAGDDTHLHCAGRLEGAAERLGCKHRIRVIPTPSANEKRRLYQSADIFIAPSDNLQETFGLTLIEAMAAGLPVIAADWNGYRDIVVDSETGHLVPTVMPIYPPRFDMIRGTGAMKSIDLLAATTAISLPHLLAAMQELVINAEKRKHFGHAAAARARQFYDWRVVIQAYESLWQELNDIARASPTAQDSFIDIEGYDYRTIFSHYPSTLLDLNTSFTLTELGMVCANHSETTAYFVGELSGFFDLKEMQEILREVKEAGSATIGHLVSRRQHPHDEDGVLAMATVGRMIKYGLLQPEIYAISRVGMEEDRSQLALASD